MEMSFATIWSIVVYLVGLYPRYYMFKAAGFASPWLAFIPFVGEAMVLKLIRVSPVWYVGLYLISLIPVVGGIIRTIADAFIYWSVAAHFGLGIVGKVLTLFFWPIVQWYIALTGRNYSF